MIIACKFCRATPPGEYRLSVGLYDLGSGQRAPVFDDTGQIVGDNVVLDTVVKVTAPRVPPAIDSLQMQGRIDRDYGGSRLLGWSIESPIVQTPNFARLTLFWQGNVDQAAAQTVQAELVDRAGNSVQADRIERAWSGAGRNPAGSDRLLAAA